VDSSKSGGNISAENRGGSQSTTTNLAGPDVHACVRACQCALVVDFVDFDLIDRIFGVSPCQSGNCRRIQDNEHAVLDDGRP